MDYLVQVGSIATFYKQTFDVSSMLKKENLKGKKFSGIIIDDKPTNIKSIYLVACKGQEPEEMIAKAEISKNQEQLENGLVKYIFFTKGIPANVFQIDDCPIKIIVKSNKPINGIKILLNDLKKEIKPNKKQEFHVPVCLFHEPSPKQFFNEFYYLKKKLPAWCNNVLVYSFLKRNIYIKYEVHETDSTSDTEPNSIMASSGSDSDLDSENKMEL